MKIVVLDGYTLNPGDLGWDLLRDLGEVIIYDRTSPEDLIKHGQDAEIILTNKAPISEADMMLLPKLKYIGFLATGYNAVDIEAAKRRGIIVTNVPTYGTRSVAQMTFALLLELCHHVGNHSQAVKGGQWSNSKDFCFWNSPLVELAGKTMGIIGYGRIGQQVAEIAKAFGMEVIAYSRGMKERAGREVQWRDLSELLKESDVVSLHCPLFPETKGIINRDSLRKMKATAFLINTSRGPLIIEEDLAEALNSGAIAGAGLDVLAVEPPPVDNPLLTARNCIITPHISWATKEARVRLMATVVENLKAYIGGSPINNVTK